MSFHDPLAVFRVVAALVAITHLIAGAQLIVNRRLFDQGALFGPQHLDGRAVAFMAVLKVAFAVAVVSASAMARPLGLAVAGLCAVNVALVLLAPYGNTAADDLANVTAMALWPAALVGSVWAVTLSLWFIALQSVLAYASAGIAKSPYRGWRDGTFVRELLSTACFGNARTARFMRESHGWPRVVGRFIVLAEILFPLVLVAPTELAVAALVAGVAFHAAVALIMGLNLFFWAFAATYPALLFVNLSVQR